MIAAVRARVVVVFCFLVRVVLFRVTACVAMVETAAVVISR